MVDQHEIMPDEWNIDQVVENIEFLYSTNDSERVRQIQQFLLPLQKSTSGFDLGQLLLKHPSKSCKYFGALTLTIFINTHLSPNNDSIDSERIDEVSNGIIEDIIGLSARNTSKEDFDSNLFIIRKLFSNLSLLYINHFNEFTIDPITALFCKTGDISNDAANYNLQTAFLEFNEIEIALFFIFNSIIVEDITKKDSINSSQELHRRIHEIIFPNLNSALAVLNNDSVHTSNTICLLVLNCINSWAIYISTAENSSSQRYTENDDCQQIVATLINQFKFKANTAEELQSEMETLNQAFTTLTEILETYPRIINQSKQVLARLLFGNDGFGYLFIQKIIMNKELAEEYSLEIENFINLLIAYLNLNIVFISRNLLDPEISQIMDVVINLTNYDGNPTLDEKVSEQFLAFWEEFLNIYIDDAESIESILKEREVYDQFIKKRDEVLTTVSSIYWQKTHFYPNAPVEFLQYRLQVSELFILLYSLLNTSIYSTLCKNASEKLIECQNSFTPSLLLDLEASLYLLHKVTDDLTFYDDESVKVLLPYIDQFFSHQLIETIERYSTESTEIVSITLLNLLSSIPFFFKSDYGLRYLPTTFNFLFSIILNPNKKNLSLIGSKTVLKICQDSKDKLIEFLPNLEIILLEMIRNIEIDNLIRERMVNSYISITSSLKDPTRLGDAIFKLLSQLKVQTDIVMNNSLQLFTTDPGTGKEVEEKIEDYAVSLLSCLNEIGRATQLPEDLEDYLSPQQISETEAYWNQDHHGIKSLILGITNSLSLNFPLLHNSTLATEKSCKILKNGLNEPINGPFKFELPVIFNFLLVKANNCNTPSISFIFRMIETIVLSSGPKLTPQDVDELILKFFVEKKALFETEVDLIAAAIHLFSTILERYPSLILELPVFQSEIIEFCLNCFKYHETFLIKADIKFWTHVIMLKRGKAHEHQFIQGLMTNKQNSVVGLFGNKPLGYILTKSAVMSFVDNPRSHLEFFYPLFRNLVSKYPLYFKNWLRSILLELYVDTGSEKSESKLSMQYVDQFISKVMLTRGHRQANEILKEFWLDTNNLVDYKSK
ncbi:member of the karyopherin-beta family [Scheffersomyces xylosifermentans]|uniref:member of the karyopherin-beta family n=1 Tax=Scheffersomyces xylosifermentans TaxID=1304137 RepID=UPI00315DC3DF